MRTLLFRSAALLALAMSLSACAGGQVAEMDAMTPVDDSVFIDDFAKDLDGPNLDSPPEPGRCGQASQRCCGGGACERGLDAAAGVAGAAGSGLALHQGI